MSLYSYSRLFLQFFYYSFLGYIVETTHVSVNEHKLNLNRGFCVGPYIPIYGVGSLLILYFISPYVDNPFLVWVLSVIVCSLVEYIVSYLAELLLKARLWNYKDHKYNINGRICLENSIYFGVGGLFVVYVLNPIINRILDLYSEKGLIICAIIWLIVFIIDFCLSIYVAIKFRNKVSKLNDSTIFINKKRKMMNTKFEKNFIGRLLKGFPYLNESLNADILDRLNVFNKKR